MIDVDNVPWAESGIADEVQKTLAKLGAGFDVLLAASDYSPAELYETMQRLGAKSDLLQIVGSWQDTREDQWVLDELRRWNARDR